MMSALEGRGDLGSKHGCKKKKHAKCMSMMSSINQVEDIILFNFELKPT